MVNVVNISGVREPSWIQRMADRFPRFWKSKMIFKRLPENKHNRLVRYDQKKDGSCTVFASCGALCNNIGINLTNEEIRDIAVEFDALDGAVTGRIASKVAQMYHCEYEVIDDLLAENTQLLLAKGYELVVAVRCKTQLFDDGMIDGIVDSEYGRGTMGHAIRLKMIDGKTCLVNSWGAMVAKGYRNEYEIDLKRAIETKTMKNIGWFIG